MKYLRGQPFAPGVWAKVWATSLLSGGCAYMGYHILLYLRQISGFEDCSAYQIWFIVGSGIAGGAALNLAEDRLGHTGLSGSLNAVAVAFWMTFVSALIAGTLALPLYGTMFAPFAVILTFTHTPPLALVWAGVLMAAHMLMIRARNCQAHNALAVTAAL